MIPKPIPARRQTISEPDSNEQCARILKRRPTNFNRKIGIKVPSQRVQLGRIRSTHQKVSSAKTETSPKLSNAGSLPLRRRGFVALDQKNIFCLTTFPEKCIPELLLISMSQLGVFAFDRPFFVSKSSKNGSNRSPNGLQTEYKPLLRCKK